MFTQINIHILVCDTLLYTVLHDSESEDREPVTVGSDTPSWYCGWFPVAGPPGKMLMHCQHGSWTHKKQGSVMHIWNVKCSSDIINADWKINVILMNKLEEDAPMRTLTLRLVLHRYAPSSHTDCIEITRVPLSSYIQSQTRS